MTTTHIGTWVHGTHRPQDLVPAFLDLLAEVHPEAYEQCFHLVPAHAMEDDDAAWWTEEAPGHLEGLIDHLNECAPEGHYFGTHPGDGSDFGYWPIEDLNIEVVGGEELVVHAEPGDDARAAMRNLSSVARLTMNRLVRQHPLPTVFIIGGSGYSASWLVPSSKGVTVAEFSAHPGAGSPTNPAYPATPDRALDLKAWARDVGGYELRPYQREMVDRLERLAFMRVPNLPQAADPIDYGEPKPKNAPPGPARKGKGGKLKRW